MGRLLTVHPCPICNYFVEDELSEGGSGIAPIFLRNRYVLAICADCKQVVSVIVPNTAEQMQTAFQDAQDEIIQMEADLIEGDPRAKELLPLFREALDTFDRSADGEATRCTICDGTNLTLLTDFTDDDYDSADMWISCPKCEEGQLLIESTGKWD